MKWPKTAEPVLSILRRFFNENKIKSTLQFGGSFFIFIIFSVLFSTNQFYEDEIYRAHFLSIVHDFDFNIINQLPERMAWIVAPSYFFPSGHSEVQSPVLFILNTVECISSYFFKNTFPSVFLTAILMNFLSLWWTHLLLKKICRLLKIPTTKFDYLFLIFASSLLFFSFLTTTVLDVTMLPLITLLILYAVSRKKFNLPLAVLSLSILTITKHYTIAVVLTFAPILIKEIRKKNVYKQLGYLFLYLMLPIAGLTNYYLKFGFIRSTELATNSISNYSIDHIVEKIIYGYFGDRGLFTLQPIVFLGVICFFVYLGHLFKEKKIFLHQIFLIVLWISFGLGSLFFLRGDFYEDRIPGRNYILVYPLIFIGIIWIKNVYLLKYKSALNILALLLVFYNVFLTFSFNFVDAYGGHFSYATQLLPDSIEALVPYFRMIQFEFSRLQQSFACILLFTVLATALFKKMNTRIMILPIASWSIIFIIFSMMNFHYSDKNIERLKQQNFFSTKVIGNGSEIYIFDYVLERAQVIFLRKDSIAREEVRNFMDPYFEIVKSQTIQTQPWFEDCLNRRELNCSFFHKKN